MGAVWDLSPPGVVSARVIQRAAAARGEMVAPVPAEDGWVVEGRGKADCTQECRHCRGHLPQLPLEAGGAEARM
jgi:hypothetical protein